MQLDSDDMQDARKQMIKRCDQIIDTILRTQQESSEGFKIELEDGKIMDVDELVMLIRVFMEEIQELED